MSNTLFEVFKKTVFNLAATLVIKHNDIARTLNKALTSNRYFVFGNENFTVNAWVGNSLQSTVGQVGDFLPSELTGLAVGMRDDVEEMAKTQTITFQYSWKYYRNLAGKYHETDYVRLYNAQYEALKEKYSDDTRLGATLEDRIEYLQHLAAHIYIHVAVDNGEPIPVPFTREQLQLDTSLATEYRIGTPLYNELVYRYKDDESFINSILTPVPEYVSINSEDAVILTAGDYVRTYNPAKGIYYYSLLQNIQDGKVKGNNLVETNETNLIPKLNHYIKAFMTRWHNTNYLITDDLYMATVMGVLYSQLPMAIFNIRLENCKTSNAHSYHISQYLDSHGRLAKHIPALSKKQSLWLYRNVDYLEANVGKQETFEDLVQHMLTESAPKIPLAGFDMRHNLSNIRTYVEEFEDIEEGIYPEPVLIREAINFNQPGAATDSRTIAQMVEKEAALGKDALKTLQEDIETNTFKLTHTKQNRHSTKILESSVIDLSDRLPYRLTDVLYNNWIYKAANDTYQASVFFTHPITSQRLSVTTKNAFLLFLYVYNKGHTNIVLTELPQLINARIIPRFKTTGNVDVDDSYLPALPTGETLPSRPTTLSYFEYLLEPDKVNSQLLEEMMGSDLPEYRETVYSNDRFYDLCVAIHKEMMRRYYLYVKQNDLWVRGYMQGAFQHMYWHDVPCVFDTENTLYSAWLDSLGLDLSNLQQTDYVSLSRELLINVTGSGENVNKTLRDLQTSVLAIVKQFSSYGIQYLQEIKDSPALLENWTAVRYTNQKGSEESYDKVIIPLVNDANATLVPHHKLFVPFRYEHAELNLRARELRKKTLNTGLTFRVKGYSTVNTRRRVVIPTVRIMEDPSETVDISTLIPNVNLDGFDYYDPNA